jgi:hypothetical protein
MNVYLYGIARWPVPWDKKPDALGAGVGEPPRAVKVVRHRALAALVTPIDADSVGAGRGVRGLRRDMRAHADVLNRAVGLGASVLPVQFGVLLPDEQSLVKELLEPRYRPLDAHLERLSGAVELTVKVDYVEEQALGEVVAEAPQLSRQARALAGRGSSTAYQSKIELGRRVAEALRAKRQRDARAIVNALAPAVADVQVKDPGADTVVLRASFLVARENLPKFDKLLEKLALGTESRMRFDCVGPLPPFSFVDLKL